MPGVMISAIIWFICIVFKWGLNIYQKIYRVMFCEEVWIIAMYYIEGLMRERRNFIANALELSLSWTNPSIWIKISKPCCYVTRSTRNTGGAQQLKLVRCKTIFWPPYILTPGSIYRTTFWPRGQYIVTIFWPPLLIMYRTILLVMNSY